MNLPAPAADPDTASAYYIKDPSGADINGPPAAVIKGVTAAAAGTASTGAAGGEG